MLQACQFNSARAYSLGLYLERGPGLDSWLTKQSGNVALPGQDHALLLREALAEPSIARSFHLTWARDVPAMHVAKGFDQSLIHRVREAQGSKDRTMAGKQSLQKLTTLFLRRGQMEEGTKVIFDIRGDTLDVVINSELVLSLESAELCWAIVDMYTGPKCVTPAARDNFAVGLSRLVSSPDATWSMAAPPGTHRLAHITTVRST
mmetsp:Transcript_51284/g.120349  ORF Transcript_51284/g.120349 Transcript_51284/m.120349 type:complete len:205 (-) Transcript_51284:72-686(-)